MNKILTKTIKKAGLLSIILAAILAISLVIGLVFGFNGSVKIKDSKTLTVSLNQYAYATKMDKVEAECEKAFKGLDFKYQIKGTMSGDASEIVYVFDKDASDAKLESAKTTLDGVFATWDGDFITVSIGGEKAVRVLPEGYVLRGVIACAVFVLLAFVYVALRYNLKMGGVVALTSAVGAALTAGLIALLRIPVTISVSYVFATAALLTAVTSLLSFNKSRANKSDEISENVAVCEISLLTVLLGGALILVGALATVSTRWFALAALIGVLVSAVMGLVFAPAWYLALKKSCAKKSAGKTKSGYVGAKKSVKNAEVKAEEPQTVAPVAESVKEEAPAEEVSEEVAEEIPAEEVSEEVAEEAPAEEVAEEVSEKEANE